jgi:uncharacterized coiled-coil DUF342 family protein
MDQIERIENMKRHLNDLKELNATLDRMIEQQKELNAKLDRMIEQQKELNAKLDRIIEQQSEPKQEKLTKNQISEIVNDPWED